MLRGGTGRDERSDRSPSQSSELERVLCIAQWGGVRYVEHGSPVRVMDGEVERQTRSTFLWLGLITLSHRRTKPEVRPRVPRVNS